jgi:5-methylcytosine-specific restriction enzyme A
VGLWGYMPTAPKRFDPLKAAKAAGLIKRTPRQESDERRGSAASRGYDSRWAGYSRRRLRKAEHALCVCCKANGIVRPATLTDHIVPGRRKPELFWVEANHQSLCDACHNTVKKVLEARLDLGLATESDMILARPLPEFFAPP